MVDSTDRERLSISKEELHKMLESDELCKAAVLVFANKQVILFPQTYILRSKMDNLIVVPTHDQILFRFHLTKEYIVKKKKKSFLFLPLIYLLKRALGEKCLRRGSAYNDLFLAPRTLKGACLLQKSQDS